MSSPPPSVLRACGEILDLGFGREIHSRTKVSGLGQDLFVGIALAALYVKCRQLDVARNLFDRMPERDVVTWNSMISGYGMKGMWEEAFGLLELIPKGSQVNTVKWNTIIGVNLRMRNFLQALRLISQMRTSGLAVDYVTLIIGLNVYSRIGTVRLGREIHGLVFRMHCDGLENVRNALTTMCSRCARARCAYILFRKSESQSLITWNAMITGFVCSHRTEEASWVFRDMVRSGKRPNNVTLTIPLLCSTHVANHQHGRELHCFIIRSRFEGNILIWNSLLDLYSKSGRIAVAQRVFDMMGKFSANYI